VLNLSDSVCSPLTNRGVQDTSKMTLVPLVDWLQVTFKNTDNAHRLLYYLNKHLNIDIDSFIDSKGRYYYTKSLESEFGVSIFYDGMIENMGIHLQVTGKGCRWLESTDEFSWSDFFYYLNDFGKGDYNVTRLDIALDDFRTFFTLEEVVRKLEKNEITSKLEHVQYVKSMNISDSSSKGTTVYFGKSDGMIQIRFYEKDKELHEKGYVIDRGIKKWNRYELQLRNERAEQVFELIKNDNSLGDTVKSILNSYIKIRTKKKGDTNKSRWPIWHKWKNLIGTVTDLKITISKNEMNLDKSIEWIDKQVKKTLAKIHEVDETILFDLISQGKLKLDLKDKKDIYNYKKSRNDSD